MINRVSSHAGNRNRVVGKKKNPTPTPTATSSSTPTPTPTSTQSSVNKIVYYNFSNTLSYSGGTSIRDLQGNVNATLYNSPTSGSTGCGSYLSFNGTNQYILTNSDLSPRFPGTSPNKSTKTSIFMWVYPTGNGVLLSELGQTAINSSWHDSQIEMVGGALKFSLWPHGSIITSSIATPFNNWYYIGFTYDGTTLKAYVNGNLAGQSTITREAPYNEGSPLYYAINALDSTSLGDGTYGDSRVGSFEVFDGAITGTDVINNYNNTLGNYFCPTPTPTATPTNTATATPTNTPTPTATSTPTPTPTPIPPVSSDPTLQIWYDASDVTTFNPSGANGTVITQWSDKSSTAHNATPISGSPGVRPAVIYNVKNGKSALHFDGTDGLAVNMSTNLQSLSGSTMIVVCKADSLGIANQEQHFVEGAVVQGSSYTPLDAYSLILNGTTGYNIFFAGGKAVSNATADTNFHIHSVVFDGSQSTNNTKLKHRVDGVDRTLTFSQNVGTATSALINAIAIGAQGDNTANLTGYIGEILIYTRTLSVSEITNTENYLKTKWGIS